MVLERLVNPKKVEGKPWEMFFIGIVYSLVGVGLGYWVFESYVSLIMVTFTAIAAIPFIRGAIESEEMKEKKFKAIALLKEHGKVISMFTFLFFGFVATFSLLYVFLPAGMIEKVFEVQIAAIIDVNNSLTGDFTSLLTSLGRILTNNLGVLLFCLIFSFFYGMGAIFILSWNASVMGAAVGSAIRGTGAVSINFIGYFVHGIPEIMAYFVAGLAGGIISVALMREGLKSKIFVKASKDSLNLIAIAAVLLILAALIEVYISPSLL
jgi:uncharacterized membrane protein SpoIIM required for sporulation